jgi:phage-related protein
MGGSEAVFGKYATNMQNKAKEAFSQMGLSTSDYLATANKMGSLFQGAGFSIEESMDLSSGAMQRAADVASIMGIDTASAMEAIAGAAKGNFTMMDNLGVAMNDTTLQAYALEKGISKSTSEMTNQEKIGLAMEMFMEKTAYAAGNYAKENETLAGSLGTAKAALTNFLDGSGSVEDVVSSFGNLANVAVRSLKEILPRLTTGLTDIVNQIMPMLPGLLNQLLPACIEGAVGLLNGLISALPGLLDVLINSAIPQLLSGIGTIFEALISALPGLVESICSALPTLLPLLINGLVSMIVTLCTNFSAIIQPIIDILPELIVSVCDALISNLPALIMGVGQLIVGVAQAIPSLLGAIWQTIKGVLASTASQLGEWLSPAWSAISGWFSNLWQSVVSIFDKIKNAISTALRFIGSIFSAAFQIITLPFRFIWENCKEYVFAAFEWIKDKISIAVDFIKNLIHIGFSFVKEKIVQPISEAKDKAVEAFTLIKNQILERIIAVKNKVSEIFGNIKSKISDTTNSIKATVTNVFSKVKDAMEKPIQKARDTIKGIVDKIKGFFSGLKLKFPDIKLPHFKVSPSGWKIGDLLKGSIPKLGIEWYAKAMQNPIVMTKPTIWGYDPETGKMQGGGEAGTEVVSGATTLMNMIQAAVSAQNDGILYILERILEILAEYFPEFAESLRDRGLFDPDAAARLMAKPMNRELGRLKLQEERGR